MTIKMKKIKKSKEKKKIEKSLINIMNKKIDLINSTAILPPFKKLNLK
jgi:predicted nucleotidyltransferase